MTPVEWFAIGLVLVALAVMAATEHQIKRRK